MPSTNGLAAFLNARIDEDERVAQLPFGTARTRARRLREAEVKRRLVAEVRSRSSHDVAQIYLATLSAVYSDHPDYDSAWSEMSDTA